mgnify:FL=1
MPSLPSLKCSGCGACEQICPKSAISMTPNDEGFLYPEVGSSLCVECRLCEKICPVLNVKTSTDFSERKAYAAICRDEKIRLESSSGGMFTVLAEKVIADGGVVFGAEFDSDFSVRHGWTDSVFGLERFRGSKYLQSRTESSFSECRKFLDDGRKVLYTGTPCQIAGLKAFLKKDYENLFTVDVICHGVPSPALWQKYIKFREKKSASRIVKTAFRRKNDGWKLYSLSFTFANGSEYSVNQSKGMWMLSFNKNVMMRNSCYDCVFKGSEILSDITIGDFWGIQNYIPEKDDDKGYSICFLNTDKGEKLFKSVKSSLFVDEIKNYDCKRFNTQLLYSIELQKNRKKFISLCIKESFAVAYKKYVKVKFPVRVYYACRWFGGKILRNLGLRK